MLSSKSLLVLALCAVLGACGGSSGSGVGSDTDTTSGDNGGSNTDGGGTNNDGSGGDGSGGDGSGGDATGGVDTGADSRVQSSGGFAGHDVDLTGGAGGLVYTVNNGLDLQAKLDEAKQADQPITLYIDGVISDFNNGGSGVDIAIKDMDNVSLVGLGSTAEFDGIGLAIRRANNIIIQNITFHEAWPGQERDAIGIEGDDDGSTTEHIWIDHCELYNSLQVGKDYYDGLIDSKAGARNITVSYSYLHDAWKTSLHGHTEDDSASANTDRFLTMHHNRFENLSARVPLFRHGRGHIYNNYYNNVSSTAINSRIGAELLIEHNVFENTRNPIVSYYSDVVGFWNAQGNIFGSGVSWGSSAGTDITAEDGVNSSSYAVPYTYSLDTADTVKQVVLDNAGVGKLDQSGLSIPAPVTPIDQVPVPDEVVIEDVALPYTENFAAVDTDTFFSNSYRDLSGAAGEGTAMNHRVTGTAIITGGGLSLTGARVSFGNSTPEVITSATDSTNTGVFDLSEAYNISFTVISVGGETNKKFSIYVDNNTPSRSSSIWGDASKFYEVALADLPVGGTVSITGLVASHNSFLTLRTESSATIVLDDLVIQAAN